MNLSDDAGAKSRRGQREPQPAEIAQVPSALLTVETVAHLAGVKPRTIWLWASLGKCPKPAHRSRNMTRWRAGDVTAWLATRGGHS